MSKGGGNTLICGDFSVALRGELRFVFNFKLGQWNFACHQPYTKSNCKKCFSSHYFDFKYLYDAFKVNLQVQDK